jgi:photosystem II stability/assembly factor-like uncharacterized protein
VFFYNNVEGWIVGSTGIIYNTSNSGTNWNYVAGPQSNPNYYGVYFTDQNTGFLSGAGGTILKTTNHGNSWTPQNSNTTEDINDMEFAGRDSGMVVGDNGIIRETTNGGETWNSISSGVTSNLNDVAYDNNGYVWIIGDGGVILTNRPAAVVANDNTLRLPKTTELLPAYPNPFNPGTNIKYNLSERSNVSVIVYDIMGRKVSTLVDNQILPAGTYNNYWNASNEANGVYLVVLQTTKSLTARKLLLLK